MKKYSIYVKEDFKRSLVRKYDTLKEAAKEAYRLVRCKYKAPCNLFTVEVIGGDIGFEIFISYVVIERGNAVTAIYLCRLLSHKMSIQTLKEDIKMKKYMVLAKNDYNEEIFYTDIKAEAKNAFDRMMDKYLFVKAFCYNTKGEVYQDITENNTQSVFTVQTYDRVILVEKPDDLEGEFLNEERRDFTNKEEALRYIIQSMKVGRKYRLYKNGRRDWSV